MRLASPSCRSAENHLNGSYVGPAMENKQRCYLLLRFQNSTEVPVLKDKEVADVLSHYMDLVTARLGVGNEPPTVVVKTTDLGSLLFTFEPDFPDSELPFNGGIESFHFNGFEHRFDAVGANTVRTLKDAEHLHKLRLCKPHMCPNHNCINFCGALDEFTFLAPMSFFARQCLPPPGDVPMQLTDIFEGDLVFDANDESGGNDDDKALCVVSRSTPLLLDEYVIELEQPKLRQFSSEAIINSAKWELYPVPSDASRLDMHLAQISSLDTKYVSRFTREVRYMDFRDTSFKPRRSDFSAMVRVDSGGIGESEPHEVHWDSDSDTDSYVESALIPGLRHRDFSKPISTAKALAGLTLDPETERRMLSLLDHADR